MRRGLTLHITDGGIQIRRHGRIIKIGPLNAISDWLDFDENQRKREVRRRHRRLKRKKLFKLN